MLTKTFSFLWAGLILGLTSMAVVASTKDQATELPKNCQYLKEVATNQTHIRKQIDAIGKNNFNTDFAVPMKRGETYSLPFQSPTGRQPYQINFNINGMNNNAYTIAVMACK